jgi:hypothetical protein
MTYGTMPAPEPERAYALLTDSWDPKNEALDPGKVASMVQEVALMHDRVRHLRTDLESQPNALLRSGITVEIPDEWVESRGSPAYYLRAAEGYLAAAWRGTVCRDEHPPSVRAERPPPPDRWCCSHHPPHCVPPP